MSLTQEELATLLVDAMERTPAVVLVLTVEGVVLHANAGARVMLGGDLQGQSLAEMVDALSGERVSEALVRAGNGTAATVEATFPGDRAVEFALTPTGPGDRRRVVATGRPRLLDVSVKERLSELNRRYDEKVRELASLTGKLRELATTDALTNLFNRRAFMDRAGAEWQRALRHGTPLSCVIFDLDEFKDINDSYGHAVGDEVLRVFGSLLRASVRASDIPARFGGEEFVALLPLTEEEGAMLLAERVRTRFFEHPVLDAQGQVVRVTCSAGVACSLSGYRSLAELLSQADTALYKAKHAGRDQVVAASQVMASAMRG